MLYLYIFLKLCYKTYDRETPKNIIIKKGASTQSDSDPLF
jgi:hypothetical protein